MPQKLQSFFILKITTNRLKEKNYKIHISLEDARRNSEIIRLGDSEMLRAIRRIRGKEFVQEQLGELLKEKLRLSRKQNNPENRKAIRDISDKIDEILFVDDIVVLKIDDVRHYSKINKNGLWINGIEYKRLLCSAGHARRSTVVFVNEEIWNELNEILNCGRNLKEKLNPNKFNAYFALASSATLSVSRPNFVVIPDYEIQRTMKVDWFVPQKDGIDPIFEEREIDQKINVFDGQGLISPTEAQIWSEDLGLDWLPASFIFRAAFSKGLLVVFDFHKFAYENNIREITDIYGDSHNIDDVEIILTLSQFKMADFYKNLNEYNENCKKYNFGWSVSRISPRVDKDVVTSTYQYLQAINIKTDKIEEICTPTCEWLQNISGLDWKSILIFLLGELGSFNSNNFQSADYLAKAIMLEPKCLEDSYIRKKLLRLINKKIKESYIGILKILGNYQFIVADPYAECQWALGLEVTGLVNKNFAYSQYWNKLGINKISIFRSPMTWRSEQLVLNIGSLTIPWFNYLYSGIILNIHNDWLMRLSGADLDGDIVMSTPSFTDYKYEGLNIPTYERKSANKKNINNDDLWQSDTLSFGSKIGLVTNYSTSFFSMLPLFLKEKEQELLINRIKTCNILQSCSIDKAKGIIVYSIPNWWDKWNKTGDNAEIYNKLLVKQRPYFMRFVYSSWNKKYKHHYNSYDNICIVRFGFSLDFLLKKNDLSEVEQKVKDEFISRSPLIDSNCTMNLICHFMEKEIKELKINIKNSDFNYSIYMNPEIEIDEQKLNKMSVLYKKWQAYQRNSHDRPFEEINDEDGEIQSKDEYIKVLEREAYNISNNLQELTNLLVELTYGRYGENSKEFCWRMFSGRGIIDNLFQRARGFIQIPLIAPEGDYQYLGKNYKLTNIVLGDSDVQAY